MKIECCGLTATQTKQLIDKDFPDQVETLTGQRGQSRRGRLLSRFLHDRRRRFAGDSHHGSGLQQLSGRFQTGKVSG